MHRDPVFSGKELASAWDLRLSPDGKAKNSANAYQPFEEKLRRLLARFPTKVYQLLGELAAEIERDRG